MLSSSNTQFCDSNSPTIMAQRAKSGCAATPSMRSHIPTNVAQRRRREIQHFRTRRCGCTGVTFAASQLLLHPMPAQFIHEDDRDRRIQELEAEVKAMRNAEARYRGIIENMELGIMEVDSEERVVRAHPRFCEIVGYSEEELIGNRASALLLDEEARANMDAVTASRNAGDSGLYETPIRTKQGELKWLLISGVPIHNPDGDIIGSMGIHYDITERKRDEQRMVRAMLDAEAARQTEREFLARISHEIRDTHDRHPGDDPSLGDTSMSAEQRSLWKAMLEGGEVLKQLLDGVLNLTRLDAGRMEVQEETVDVAALVSGVVAPFRPPLAEKGVELMVLLPETGTHLQLDGSLFTQVLMNLLGNAVKFTDQGAVSVEVSVVAKAGEERELHLAVTDSEWASPRKTRMPCSSGFTKRPTENSATKGRVWGCPLSRTSSHWWEENCH